MTKLNIAPSLMFQFAVAIHQLDKKSACEQAISLSPAYALPDFSRMSSTESGTTPQVNLRMAWSELGVHFQIQIPLLNSIQSSQGESQFRMFLDTRGASGNKRLTRYAQQIKHLVDFKNKSVRLQVASTQSPADSSASMNQGPRAQCDPQFNSNEFVLRTFLPKQGLYGFEPVEFPQISYFFDFQSAGSVLFNAGTDPRLKYDQDPSVWIRGNLVA